MKTDRSSRYDDLTLAELVEHALALGEGQLSAKGALAVPTQRNTVVQRFIVNEPSVSLGCNDVSVNQPGSEIIG